MSEPYRCHVCGGSEFHVETNSAFIESRTSMKVGVSVECLGNAGDCREIAFAPSLAEAFAAIGKKEENKGE